MSVRAIIHSAGGPNPLLLRILREEAVCMPSEVPVALAARVAVPQSASTT